MARLVTSGAEIRDHPTTDIGSPDGYTPSTTATVTDLAVFRQAFASFKCSGSSDSFRAWPFTAPAAGQTVHARAFVQFSALPSSDTTILRLLTSADSALVSVRLTTTGTLRLWNDAGAAQIGSDTSTVLTAGGWYRIQLSLLINTGAVDEASLYVIADGEQGVDPEQMSGTGLTVSDTHAARLRAGWVTAPGNAVDINVDDVAVNDSTGTQQNGLPPDGAVFWDEVGGKGNTVGSWRDCSGGVDPQDGLSKKPPVGLADHTTAGHTGANAHQARVAANTAQSMTVVCRTYAAAGVPMDFVHRLGTSTSATTAAIGSISTAERRAESFKFGDSVLLVGVTVNLAINGAPTDTLIAEVQGSTGTAPNGTVLASASISPSILPTIGIAPPRQIAVTMDPVILSGGTQYWLVLRRSGPIDSANHYLWTGSSPTLAAPDTSAVFYNGTAWSSTAPWRHNFTINTSNGALVPTVVAPSIAHGQATTGTKTGSFILNSPAGTTKTLSFGDAVGVAGTYPSNWRWASGSPTYMPPDLGTLPNMTITKDSGSGTAACLVCAAGMMAEFALPTSGWAQYQKTADSTLWWAKRVVNTTAFELADGTVYTVQSGDYAIYPDPQIDAGGDFPATLTSVDDTTLQAGYTPV